MSLAVKFIIHLMGCAVKTTHFMRIVVECIEVCLLEKLKLIRARLRDKSYKIYESYDEYTNIN